MFILKSKAMMCDTMLVAASRRTTARRWTGTGSTCSTRRFPPERISPKDFPSMFDTSTPILSSGGKSLKVGIVWLNSACAGYKRRNLRPGRLLCLKV